MKYIANPSTGIISVSFRANGKGVLLSTKTKNQKDAIRFVRESGLAKIEQAAKIQHLTMGAIQSIVYGGRKVRLKHLAEEWVEWMEKSTNMSMPTVTNYRNYVKMWMKFADAREKGPSEIEEADIKAFVDRPAKAKGATREVALAAIRSFFHWQTLKGYRTGNPAALVQVDYSKLDHTQKEQTIRQPFTDDEVERLLAIASPFWRIAILFGRHTALRLGDIVQMEWSSIQGDELVKWTEKRDRRVVTKLSDVLLAELLAVKREHPKYLFPSECNMYRDKDARSNLSCYFGRLVTKAGIVGKSFHSLRHAKATEIFHEGGIDAVKKALGHSSTKTSEGYVHA